MRDDLPPSVVNREKQGFNPPLGRWLQGPLLPWMRDVIHQASPPIRDLLDLRALDAALDRVGDGASDDWPTLWRVANLCAWDAYSFQPILQRVTTPVT
jgi:asparagine synthase (glutamine-hydrolysing)